MARFLFYVSPAVGHTLPLVPGLLELRSRGHAVHVRGMPSLVPVLQQAGLERLASGRRPRRRGARSTDYRATTDADRLRSGQVDLIAARTLSTDRTSTTPSLPSRPDAVLVDVNAYGAQTRAEASGLPRVAGDPLGGAVPGRRVSRRTGSAWHPCADRSDASATQWRGRSSSGCSARRMLPGPWNPLRAESGLAPLSSPLDLWYSPDAVIALTGPPLEYARTDLPAHVHLVGTQPWDVPAARPAYLDEPR